MYAQRIVGPKLGTLGASVRTYRQGTSRDKRRKQVTYWRASSLYLICSAGKSTLNHNLISGADFGIRRGVMAPRTIHAHADRGPGEPGSALATGASPGLWSGHTCIWSVVFFSGRPRLASQESQVAPPILGLGPQACVDQISIRGAEAAARVARPTACPRRNFSNSRVMRRLLRQLHHRWTGLLGARRASKPVYAGIEASGPEGSSRLTRVHAFPRRQGMSNRADRASSGQLLSDRALGMTTSGHNSRCWTLYKALTVPNS